MCVYIYCVYICMIYHLYVMCVLFMYMLCAYYTCGDVGDMYGYVIVSGL